ncbi:MAG: type II toxin-antitoxin system RelE/ParE family toxin [Agathobacter sp.]
MKRLEYSQIARRKLKALRIRLTSEYGAAVSRKIIKQITSVARGLETFEEKGISISSIYGIECNYRYLYVAHNYPFYRIENDKVIVAEIFDEREDFMYKLFGIATTSQDSIDYWDE